MFISVKIVYAFKMLDPIKIGWQYFFTFSLNFQNVKAAINFPLAVFLNKNLILKRAVVFSDFADFEVAIRSRKGTDCPR